VARAVISGNILSGPERIANRSKGKVEIAMNVGK